MTVEFRLVPDWEQPGYAHEDVAAVAIDSRGRVHLHTRSEHRVSVHEPDGRFVTSWGGEHFVGAHGITIHDELAYLVDDRASAVRILDLDGGLVGRLEGPFDGCCNIAFARNGDAYVADGYGHSSVHRFGPDGALTESWGSAGTGPGQFHTPHGIAVGPALGLEEAVVVCDRENDRLQFFDLEGAYLDQWTDVQRPTDVVIGPDGLVHVAELWRPVETGQASRVHGMPTRDLPGRVSVYAPDGTVVARWGADSERRGAPGNFIAPHGLAVDAEGSLYVAEVSGSFGAGAGRMASSDAIGHQIQKFARV